MKPARTRFFDDRTPTPELIEKLREVASHDTEQHGWQHFLTLAADRIEKQATILKAIRLAASGDPFYSVEKPLLSLKGEGK